MNLDIILFGLRLLSGIMLSAWLIGLFIVLWRDLRGTTARAEVYRRVYGNLMQLIAVDDGYTPSGESYPLYPLTSLGRAPTNSIMLNDTFSSSEHATIALKNGHWWLEDRRSRNGTLLNGAVVNEATIITQGDIISIGNTHLQLSLNEYT